MIARRVLARCAAATALVSLCAAPAAAELRTGVQPYIEVQQVLNAEVDSGDVLTYTGLAAGVDASLSTRRVRAQISYRYERRFAWREGLDDSDAHSGIAQLNATLIPNLLRVNAGALARGHGPMVVGRSSVSPAWTPATYPRCIAFTPDRIWPPASAIWT
jgi:hypothetical protein